MEQPLPQVIKVSETLNEPVKEKKKRGRKPKPKPAPEDRFKVYHGSFIVDFNK